MKLYLNTISDLLWQSLIQLMNANEFNDFRMVGGTSLSLQLGHRESIDIDLFTDAEYGSVDFKELESFLERTFSYVDKPIVEMVGMGKSYFIGHNSNDLVKLDLYYTDTFVFPSLVEQSIRMASCEEIVAMKFEIIAQGGRKKDFWDIHELLDRFNINEMIEFYKKRYPYGYAKNELLLQLKDFSFADHDFHPKCFKNKDWELIKLDFEELVDELASES